MTWRIRIFFLRLADYLIHLPVRIIRLLRWLFFLHPVRGTHVIVRWVAGVILLGIDITPVPLLLESIIDFVKRKTRMLDANERDLIRDVFGQSVPLDIISMDPYSAVASRKKLAGYVSFHIINFNHVISSPVLIHEMMHVWQYSRYGAAYISEALWAQKWGGGYNYGGINSLKMYAVTGGLRAFNLEQQASIIEDYYRWKNSLPLQWAHYDIDLGPVLLSYVNEVRNGRGLRT